MCAVDPAQIAAGAAERPSPALDRMLRLGRMAPDQPVAVCGPASLPVLIGLIQRGYERVVCARETSCPGEAGASRVLVLTGPCCGPQIEAMVARAARLLADEAVVVAHEAAVDDELALAHALEARGLEATWRVHDLAQGCFVAMGVRRVRAATAAAPAQVSRAA